MLNISREALDSRARRARMLLPLSGSWRALRRDGENFQPGCTPPTGGIEMNAHEDRVRIFSGHGRTGLEGNKDVRVA
jgi:hypothetical protein